MGNTNENRLPKQQPILIKKWYQHKGIVAIFVLAILVAITSWIYFSKQTAQNVSSNGNNNKSAVLSVSLDQCNNKPDPVGQSNCFKQYGEDYKDINSCKKINIYPQDVDCAIGVAVALNNPKICDGVSAFSGDVPSHLSWPYAGNSVPTDIMLQYCYNGFAAETKDASYCASLASPQQASCYTAIATTANDDSYCSNIKTPYDQNSCLLSVVEMGSYTDTTICDQMIADNGLNDLKGQCYEEIAIKTKNISICNKIIFYPYIMADCQRTVNQNKLPSQAGS